MQAAAAKKAAAPGDLLTASMLEHGGKADAIAAGAAADAAMPFIGVAIAGQPAKPGEKSGSGQPAAADAAAGGAAGASPLPNPAAPSSEIKHIVTVNAPAGSVPSGRGGGGSPAGSKDLSPAAAEAAGAAASGTPTTAGTLNSSSGGPITPAPAVIGVEHSRVSQTSNTSASPRGE